MSARGERPRARPPSAVAGRPSRAAACWATLGMLVLAACGGEQPPAPDILAQIGDEPVAYTAFERYLAENSVDPDLGWGSDVLSGLLDQFLDEELLRRLAAARGVAAPGGGRRVAVQALLAGAAAEPVADDEVAAYYRRNRRQFELPERVRVRQLLLADADSLAAAQAELAAGAPFETLAERLSLVPVESIGGVGSALSRDDLPPTFADAIFELEPGEVSEPIATDYGFHLFEVVERLPAGPAELPAVAAEIRETLRRDRLDGALARLVEEARERYNVRLFERNLPFNYQGHYSDAPPPATG